MVTLNSISRDSHEIMGYYLEAIVATLIYRIDGEISMATVRRYCNV
jgi:hypothetical protein